MLIATLVASLFVAVAGQQVSPQALWSVVVCSNCSFGDPYLYSAPDSSGELVERIAVFAVGAGSNATTSIVSIRTDDGTVLWHRLLRTTPLAAYNGWCDGLVDGHKTTLFCGLNDGIVALDGSSGKVLWTYHTVVSSSVGAPAHPTTIPRSIVGGLVAFTFENGHHSTPLTILRGRDGTVLASTGPSNVVFTKIWRVASVAGGMVFGITDLVSGSISITMQRLVELSSDDHVGLDVVWKLSNLSYSPPGLWDNPNLDVDAAGQTVFLYEKSAIGSRAVLQLDASCGKQVWALPTAGHVADYDTYAFNNDFFRLVSGGETSLTVQRFATSTSNSTVPKWSATIVTGDMGSILLVGGVPEDEPAVFVFGLTSGDLWALDGTSGDLLWTLRGLSSVSTGIVASNGSLVLFGQGNGVYSAYSSRSL